jgi:crossover junction endodeoxyribonuclease RuvC
MITVGLDLSLTGTGVCVLTDSGHSLHTIKSKPSGDRHLDELLRLKKIVSDIEDILIGQDEEVDLVAIEGLAFMAKNTSALVQLAGLNYLVRSLLHDMNKEFTIVAPTSLKKYATGKGNGQKDLVMLEIYKKYGVTVLDNNQGDAFVLAQVARAYLKKGKLLEYEKQVINILSL